eukprot:9989004-Karenia_brevis.AAC.1
MWIEALHSCAQQHALRVEEAAYRSRAAGWCSWLHEGPARGLGRQHRFSRNALGWQPVAEAVEDQNMLGSDDGLDGLSDEQLRQVIKPGDGGSAAPLHAQQLVNAEAETWSAQWAAETEYEEASWPEDLGELPASLTLQGLRDACCTFPVGTGLGWDALHPRALCRLSDELLLRLIFILSLCERGGGWPDVVKLVIIVLLPKSDGGFRPIGLLPLPP